MPETSFQVHYRKIEEMLSPEYLGLKDPYGILALNEAKRRALVANPYLAEWNVFCQKVFSSDGIAFGGEVQFPLLVDTPIGRVIALSGSTSFVAKEYRKTEVGAHLRDYTEAVSPGYHSCGSGMSQMMVKIKKLLRVPLIFMPRYILLYKSRAVVRSKMSGVLACAMTFLLDSGLSFLHWVIGLCVALRTKGLDFVKISSDDDASLQIVADLIATDRHEFMEVHDVRWLKWMLTASFNEAGPMSLILVKKGESPVAFYMTKRRFHEQASSRGFKNVWLASITEWGVVAHEKDILPWILLHAALSFRKQVDACELVTVDPKLQKWFRCAGACHVGEGNYAFSPPIGPKPDYYSDIKNPDNWRLRPAMGDNGLS